MREQHVIAQDRARDYACAASDCSGPLDYNVCGQWPVPRWQSCVCIDRSGFPLR